eukprot:CAMPEP_0182453212 /NCGR_PEP_ID=MMETSP1319-20130603/370_1 /TAXON_ID=172717 /ORGANISM="Bolidomonas pacifica, Strain RCC208" /LENGTH=134 /DNA_ID=CAMNT_0024651113 /DNA_START=24 /DNA_END=425 /DNA_ORIENTATION=+
MRTCDFCAHESADDAAFCVTCGVMFKSNSQTSADTKPTYTAVPSTETEQGIPAEQLVRSAVIVAQPMAVEIDPNFGLPRVDNCAHCLCCCMWGFPWAGVWLAAHFDLCCQYPCGRPGCADCATWPCDATDAENN